MKLRDLMFVLPNLFTVSSIFCGFYAMTLCAGDASPLQLYQAALAIFFGIFFDGFDGRVARLTKTQSLFGQELDSLADVISFGAAPALLMWKWALSGLGMIGVFASFLFAACGALRLARFNVLAIRSPHGGASSFFVGMPIPFAACGLIPMVLAFHPPPWAPLPGQTPLPGKRSARYSVMASVSQTGKSPSTSTGTLPAGLTPAMACLNFESPSKESKRTICSWNGICSCFISTQGRIDQDE